MALPLTFTAVTIASGQSLSGAIEMVFESLVGLQMPSAWTAANLTFQSSFDGTTYADLYDDAGAEVVVVAAASRFIYLLPAEFAGFRFLKVRSGTTGTPVNQGGARDIQLGMRPIE